MPQKVTPEQESQLWFAESSEVKDRTQKIIDSLGSSSGADEAVSREEPHERS